MRRFLLTGLILALGAMPLACGDDDEDEGNGTGGAGTGGAAGATTGGGGTSTGGGGTGGGGTGATGGGGTGGTTTDGAAGATTDGAAGATTDGAAGATSDAGSDAASGGPIPNSCKNCASAGGACKTAWDACNADATCKACQETDYTKCGSNALYQALCACAAGDGGACVNQCKTYCGG